MDPVRAQKALEHFVIERKNYQVVPVQQGYINDTFRIEFKGDPLFILQCLNKAVFPDIRALMQNLETVLPAVRQEGYSSFELMPTKARKPLYEDDEGDLWRLMTYVPDSISYNTTSQPAIAYEAGKLLGIFHRLLEKVPTASLTIIIPDFHSLEKRLAQFEKALPVASKERLEKANEMIAYVEATVPYLALDPKIKIPLRCCHNDTKLNNMLFSKKNGKALCLIDLDTLMPGYFHYDFGDAVRTLVNPAEEDEQDLEKITFDLQMLESTLEGLKDSGLQLTATEKSLLSYGVILMPFLHGLRALTDYLEQDRYYKVSFPEQNLQRSKSLFTFCQKAIENRDRISEMVKKILN